MAEIKKNLALLGKEIDITLFNIDKGMAELVFDDIYKEGLRLQKIFNFFDKKSELSLLNSKRKMEVSKDLLLVLKKAISYSELNSRYDVTFGKKIVARKKGMSLPEISCSYKDIKIDGEIVFLSHPDILLDLGSIAKGYIADKLAEFMKKLGIESGFIDARGDMIIFGDEKIVINIQHPRSKEKVIHPFSLQNMSVATSGDYNQFYGDYDKNHIIGENEFISVTVIGKSLADADALATCIFLSGKDEINKLLEKKKDFSVFAINKDLNECFFNRFEIYLKKD